MPRVRRRALPLTGLVVAAALAIVGVGAPTASATVAALPPVATAAPAAAPAAPSTPPDASLCRTPIVYLVPHQDDEVLSMSASIRRMITRYGRSCVHLVLVTNGQSSGARTTLARGFRPVGHDRVERVTLDPAQFAVSRDAEFRGSAAQLGVPAGNVHFGLPGAPRLIDDGTIGPATARRVVAAAIARFGPRAGYATMSDSDPQHDHRALGVALREVGTQRRVSSLTFFYPPYQPRPERALTATVAQSSADRGAIARAAVEYGTYAPQRRRYGIGWLSVPGAFGGPALGVRIQLADGRLWQPPPLQAPKLALLRSYTSFLHH